MSENLAQSGDIYEQLGVLKDTPHQEIHKRFLKLVMNLLYELRASKGDKNDECLRRLQSLWFAHDILVDPATRTDYDLRALGIKTTENGDSHPAENLDLQPVEQSRATCSWRVGELMQAAGLLEQTELDIACDMHKAVPELKFGGFLSKHGFINERQLQGVLIGQILLRNGTITLSQFCSVMAQVDQSQREVKEILLESGYIDKAVLAQLGP